MVRSPAGKSRAPERRRRKGRLDPEVEKAFRASFAKNRAALEDLAKL